MERIGVEKPATHDNSKFTMYSPLLVFTPHISYFIFLHYFLKIWGYMAFAFDCLFESLRNSIHTGILRDTITSRRRHTFVW